MASLRLGPIGLLAALGFLTPGGSTAAVCILLGFLIAMLVVRSIWLRLRPARDER